MSFFPQLSAAFGNLLAGLEGRRVAVIGHARPDGDCIGSQVALCRVLRARGIDAVGANPDPVPRRLRFLLGDTPFLEGGATMTELLSGSGRLAVFTDCADHGRAGGGMARLFPRPHGNIDHHRSNGSYALHNLVDTGAAATAEILAGLCFDAGLRIDALAAQSLYVGVETDTGQFRFPSTTRRVFELAALLMDAGADPSAASAEVYERESFEKLELLGRFIESLERTSGGLVCLGVLRERDFAETGARQEDTEGLVDYARAIDGVRVGVLVEERPEGVKASLRAKDPAMRVDRVAAEFGGGGHACAAGLNVEGEDVDCFIPRLVAAIEARIREVGAAPERL